MFYFLLICLSSFLNNYFFLSFFFVSRVDSVKSWSKTLWNVSNISFPLCLCFLSVLYYPYIYLIYTYIVRGAGRGCLLGRRPGRDPLTVCFFTTCYSIYFIPANAFCDVMCILAVIIIIIRSLTVVFWHTYNLGYLHENEINEMNCSMTSTTLAITAKIKHSDVIDISQSVFLLLVFRFILYHNNLLKIH